MKIIEVKNVSVNYGNVKALDQISFSIDKGSFLGIIGPNGGGKTTLIKVLLGLIKPDKGEIIIHSDKPIGYVPQFNNFERRFPITVCKVILMGSMSHKKSIFHKYSAEDKEKSNDVMKLLGIEHLRNRLIKQLSGGQMQKVLIARALMTEPDLLILDEPTASIDSQSRTDIYNLLNTLKGDKTILIISHDIGTISSYIDSIACLNVKLYYHEDGQITQDTLSQAYGCPVDLVAHGIPHRVLPEHLNGGHHHD
ncbi:MAG: metal ABC transporter ATP-binding protein [Clostridiales bacterium]|nr:metal ABC transporter ATP-binding protein [Clostridiales bacterium]